MAEPLDLNPTPDLLSDETLTAMERDGWTPGQVRDLIERYREVVRELARRDEVEHSREHAFAMAEIELRELNIAEVRLYPHAGAAIEQRHPAGGSLTTESSVSLLGAVDRLRRLRHG